MLTDRRNWLVGVKQSKKAINDLLVESVFIANDADDTIKHEFFAMCKFREIPINTDFSKAQLGKMCEIEVGAAIVSVLKQL